MNNGSPDITDTNTVQTVDEIIAQSLEKQTDGTYAGLKGEKLKDALSKLDISADKSLAVTSEIRRRNTESSFTRANQKNLELQAELDVYKTLVPTSLNISDEDQEALDTLKYSDPDAWFERVSDIKAKAKDGFSSRTEEAVIAAKQEAVKNDTVASRAKLLEQFNSNTATPLTDEQLQYDIPPRLLKRVENGELAFGDMIQQAHDFINGNKVVEQPEYTEEPTFDGTPGGGPTEPGDKKVSNNYNDMKF